MTNSLSKNLRKPNIFDFKKELQKLLKKYDEVERKRLKKFNNVKK